MNEKVNKLVNKMEKRLGLKVLTKCDNRIGVISDYIIDAIDEGTVEERLTVNYLLAYGEGDNTTYKLESENNVIILLGSNIK